MRQVLLLTFALLAVSTACQKSKSSQETIPGDTIQAQLPSVNQKWETDTLLTTCESVVYDKVNELLYVSNINGMPDAKDGNGFISKVTLEGKITELQWIKGFNAPKGMGIWNGKLYVTDIDRIHEIDIAKGNVSNTFVVEGATFLNDITIDTKGKVYASDTGSGLIVTIEGGKLSTWLDKLEGPNGLFAEDSILVMALWNTKTLNTINLGNNEILLRADSIENPDGIEAIGNGAYLVSSWNGALHYVDAEWKKTLILDTRTDGVSAADIEYIQEKKLLLIPTFLKNKVVAYELTY
jgi:hypothetical protein